MSEMLFSNRTVPFDLLWVQSRIDEFQKVGNKSGLISITAQCFPLYSILLALNRTTIDYFSLDIEGYELDVLRTIPWSKVDIKVNIFQLCKSIDVNHVLLF